MRELSDQKLCSAIRKTRPPPNQPTAARTAITINDQTPASDDVNSSNTLLKQIEATNGATPINKAGRITSEIQAVAKFVMLISANREPSSESSERRFELDASSSIRRDEDQLPVSSVASGLAQLRNLRYRTPCCDAKAVTFLYFNPTTQARICITSDPVCS